METFLMVIVFLIITWPFWLTLLGIMLVVGWIASYGDARM